MYDAGQKCLHILICVYNIVHMKKCNSESSALRIFKKNRGILTTKQILNFGIHRRTLYKLRDEGKLIKITNGLYKLADMPELSNPDFVTVAMKVPKGVVCLISALSFHEITTHIPHKINIAVKRGARTPQLKYPPLDVVRFSGESFEKGIGTHKIDGVNVKIYNPAKTIVDCFKFLNKVGLDVAIEALKFGISRKKVSVGELFKYAKVCSVEKIIRPYIEAI
jgi:predicted transcriptional regulator of viral defense system